MHVEISRYHSVFEHRPWRGTWGEHIGHLHFSDMGHPKQLGCSHVVFPGKPSQENFYLEQLFRQEAQRWEEDSLFEKSLWED